MNQMTNEKKAEEISEARATAEMNAQYQRELTVEELALVAGGTGVITSAAAN